MVIVFFSVELVLEVLLGKKIVLQSSATAVLLGLRYKVGTCHWRVTFLCSGSDKNVLVSCVASSSAGRGRGGVSVNHQSYNIYLSASLVSA